MSRLWRESLTLDGDDMDWLHAGILGSIVGLLWYISGLLDKIWWELAKVEITSRTISRKIKDERWKP